MESEVVFVGELWNCGHGLVIASGFEGALSAEVVDHLKGID